MFVDFCIGHGEGSEWIGTVEVSGNSIPTPILEVTSELEFRRAIQCLFQEWDQTHCLPPNERTVPWTDYVYEFIDGKVYGSRK